MNVAILRGRLSSPPREQELTSGSLLVSLEVTIRPDDGPAESVPVAWFPDPKRKRLTLAQHQEIVVVGRVRRRFFQAGGKTASRTEVVADAVALASRAGPVARAVDQVLGGIQELAESKPSRPAKAVRRG